MVRANIGVWGVAIIADAWSTMYAVSSSEYLNESNPFPAFIVATLTPVYGRIGAHVAAVAVASSLAVLLVGMLLCVPTRMHRRAVLLGVLLTGVLKILVSAHNVYLTLV